MKKYYVDRIRGFANEKLYLVTEYDFNIPDIFERTTRKEMERDLRWIKKESKYGVANNIRVEEV